MAERRSQKFLLNFVPALVRGYQVQVNIQTRLLLLPTCLPDSHERSRRTGLLLGSLLRQNVLQRITLDCKL
jgi:hypothetical protein